MLTIEIWSDVVCPWCYIGKRRWEAVLAGFPHADEIRTEWRAFELRPHQPTAPGATLAETMRRDGHTQSELDGIFGWISELGEQQGIVLQPQRYRPVNSFDAHRIVKLAASYGLADAMTERILRAYHGELRNIADHKGLRALAADVGVPADEVTALLEGDAYADEVRADEAMAARIKVTSVPSFVVDGREAAHGALETDALSAMLEEVWARHAAETRS